MEKVFVPVINKEMDSAVFAAPCIPCIIIPCCQGGRKEGGRKERGGNCAERKATDPDKLNALDLGKQRQEGGRRIYFEDVAILFLKLNKFNINTFFLWLSF